MNNKTKTVFRWYHGYGECIALFPQNAAGLHGYLCSSFMHVGQHGPADSRLVVSQTRSATRKEYMPLAKELRQRGYKLDICKRCLYRDLQIRLAEAQNWA